VWPSAHLGTLTVQTGLSRLTLPVRRASAALPADVSAPRGAVRFGPPEAENPPLPRQLRSADAYRRIIWDVGSGEQRIEVLRDEGRSLIEPIGVEIGFQKSLRYTILPGDPSSARAEAHYDLVHRHAHGWDTRIRTRSAIACTATHYIIEADLEAFEAERRVFSRSWTRKIERDLC
jgi:uncharacterized protein